MMTAVPTDRLFVYGTLRKMDRTGKAALLGHAKYLGAGRVAGRLYNFGEYPGVVPSLTGNDWVLGEVYELANFAKQIARLDEYEGCSSYAPLPHEYRREVSYVKLETGNEIEAWIYWYEAGIEGFSRIESGDWLAHWESGEAHSGSDPSKFSF